MASLNSAFQRGAFQHVAFQQIDLVSTGGGGLHRPFNPPFDRTIRRVLGTKLKGETEEEKRLRRIARGILPPDPVEKKKVVAKPVSKPEIKREVLALQKPTPITPVVATLEQRIAELERTILALRNQPVPNIDEAIRNEFLIRDFTQHVKEAKAQKDQEQESAEVQDIAAIVAWLESQDS